MKQAVEQVPETLHELGVKRCEMCHSVLGVDDYQGTVVHLDTNDQPWQGDNFKKWIEAAFPYGRWANIRIQSLTFNGEPIFDFREWWEPPQSAVLEPITVKVREANVAEWKTVVPDCLCNEVEGSSICPTHGEEER